MDYDDEKMLAAILRRMLVATDDIAILADARGLQRKVAGLKLDPHDLTVAGDARSRHGLLARTIEKKRSAVAISHSWERASKEALAELAKARGGHPPEGYVWRHSKDRSDTPEEVTERHTKRLLWEAKRVAGIQSSLRVEIRAKDARIAELEARLETVRKAVEA